MRGTSADEVADRILNNTSYSGLQVCLPSEALSHICLSVVSQIMARVRNNFGAFYIRVKSPDFGGRFNCWFLCWSPYLILSLRFRFDE